MENPPLVKVTLQYKRDFYYTDPNAQWGTVLSSNPMYMPRVGEEIDITENSSGRLFVHRVTTGYKIEGGNHTNWMLIQVAADKPYIECRAVECVCCPPIKK